MVDAQPLETLNQLSEECQAEKVLSWVLSLPWTFSVRFDAVVAPAIRQAGVRDLRHRAVPDEVG